MYYIAGISQTNTSGQREIKRNSKSYMACNSKQDTDLGLVVIIFPSSCLIYISCISRKPVLNFQLKRENSKKLRLSPRRGFGTCNEIDHPSLITYLVETLAIFNFLIYDIDFIEIIQNFMRDQVTTSWHDLSDLDYQI